MTLLSYCRSRLQIALLLFGLMALGVLLQMGLWAAITSVTGANGLGALRLNWILPTYALVTGTVLWRLLALLTGDLVALKVLPEGLEARGFFSRKVIKWDQLLGSHVVDYGNLIFRMPWLKISYFVDGATYTKRVPLVLTRLPIGGKAALSQKIEQVRDEALGRPSSAAGERMEGTGLDPDAVIQRYLKAKAEAAAATPGTAATPAVEPAPLPRQPARPAFGRKGL